MVELLHTLQLSVLRIKKSVVETDVLAAAQIKITLNIYNQMRNTLNF